MSYIDVEVAEGRRCAGVIRGLAAQLGAHIEGQTCELCHILDSFAATLNVLAADLMAAADAYAETGAVAGISDGKKGGSYGQ